MKFFIPNLKVGRRVFAEVSEVLASGDLIVSFQGDLIRVANQTQKRFMSGQRIPLEVVTIKPLSFRLAESRRGIDISI